MTQPLFNSLGSNYSAEFIRLATRLFIWGGKQAVQAPAKLLTQLEERHVSRGTLVYKGRDAIELAARAVVAITAGDRDVSVGILTQGCACHAIEEGIQRGGAQPIYVDLENGSVNPSVQTLEEGVRWAAAHGVQVGAVFLQYTLGYIRHRQKIFEWARRNSLLIIEDVAQSFGAKDEHGQEIGDGADMIICSFGRDKVIDAVSGGVVLLSQNMLEHLQPNVIARLPTGQPTQRPPLLAIKKELFYPKLTQLIRATHGSGVGKVLFHVAKLLKLFTSPIAAATTTVTMLPAEYCELVLLQLSHLNEQLQHRRNVAAVYIEQLEGVAGLSILAQKRTLASDAHLRVPLLFDTAEMMNRVITACQRQQMHLTDRWYRSVVDSGSLGLSSIYVPGTCPQAESVVTRLLNLPTHEKISLTDALRICTVIKQALL